MSYKKLNLNLEKIYKNIKEYDVTYEKTKDNIDAVITTGAQKDDSDLKVVADNFQFVMWTIIAIVVVSIAIKMTRKVKRNILFIILNMQIITKIINSTIYVT